MFWQKKKKNFKKRRFIDGLFVKAKKTHFKTRNLLIILVVPILISLIFAGRLSASYVLPGIDLLSLFGSGKFLVLFQNNSEIRSSGGFIGSYAVVEVKNYEIQSLTFNTNIYALDNEFGKSNFILSPEPLNKFTEGKTWALRDSNYDASFPDAGSDITYFYEKETGDKIDGVVALNAKIIIDLLKLTGPIYLPKYNLTISADNFYGETQYQVEKAYYDNPENWVINEPKSFLKDLYPEILSRAISSKMALLGLLKSELEKKEIVFYFKDPSKEELVLKQNLGGKVFSGQGLKDLFRARSFVDSLYINSNSYSGNKSSLSIKENVDYKITSTSDYGPKMYQVALKISRIHTGSYDWPDGKNIEWLRIFVPEQAQFLEAKLNEKNISSDVEIASEGEEESLAYFGTEITTEPGQANILEINYLISYEPDYRLLVQKQPGKNDFDLRVTLDGQLLFDGVLDRDQKISFKQ